MSFRRRKSRQSRAAEAAAATATLAGLPLSVVPAKARDEWGPEVVPSREALEDDFFGAFPEMRSKVMVLDRLNTRELGEALEEVDRRPPAYQPHRELTEFIISKMDAPMMEGLDANLQDGSPFCHTFSVEGEAYYHFIQPYMIDGGLHNPAASGMGALRWHNEVEPLNQWRLTMATAGAAWHEFGHAIFNEQNFETPLKLVIGETKANDELAELMRDNGEELFCDGYSFGIAMRKGPALAIPMLRDHIHGRILNTVTGMALNGWGPKHMPDPAWRDLVHDLAKPENHASHVDVVNMAMSHVIDRLPKPEGMLEVINGFSGLVPHINRSKRFMAAIGELGQKAEHPETYVMARDYLDILDQRLPPQSGYRQAIHKAQNQLSANHYAHDWDKLYPPIETSLTRLSLELRRQQAAAPEPQPAPAPAQRRAGP
jgi:hypothetical protein